MEQMNCVFSFQGGPQNFSNPKFPDRNQQNHFDSPALIHGRDDSVVILYISTVGIWLTDMSGNRMVETCPIAEWFVN